MRRWRHVSPEGYSNERPIVPHLLPPTFTVEVEFALETFAAQPFGKKRAGSSHHHALHCFSCLVVFSTLPILHARSSRPRCLFYLLRCPLYLPRTPNHVVMLHPTVHAQEAAVVSIEGHHLMESVACKSTVGGRGRSAVAMVAAVLALVA